MFKKITYIIIFLTILGINIFLRCPSQSIWRDAGTKTPGQFGNVSGMKDGNFYFIDTDSYYWIRYVKLLLKNGFIGDEKINGRPRDMLMMAPFGMEPDKSMFFVYLSAFLYKAYSVVFGQVQLEVFLFYLPVFFAAVFLTTLFLFCRYFFSTQTGLIAMAVAGFSRHLIMRSQAGWFDSDIINLIFPLAILWVFSVGLQKKDKSGIFYFLAASLLTGLYAFTWPGWCFIAFLCLGYFAVYILVFTPLAAGPKKETKLLILRLIIFSFATVFFIRIFTGEGFFSYLPLPAINWLKIGSPEKSSIWPNAMRFVSELQPSGFRDIVGYFTPETLFYLSVIGAIWIFMRPSCSRNAHVIRLLVLWYFSMLFMSFQGWRFIFFMALPASICVSIFIADAIRFICEKLEPVKNNIVKTVVYCASAFIFSGVIGLPLAENASVKQYNVSVGSEWFDFFSGMKDIIPDEAVINSWWDLGDWFKYYLNRRVLFDGHTQHTSVAYWMARVLTTQDEQEAFNILRMLNNNSAWLFYDLAKDIPDPFSRISLFKALLQSAPVEGRKILNRYPLPQETKDRLEHVLYFKTPAPAYIVVDKNMVDTMTVISFLGNWDFAKLYIKQAQSRGSKEDILRNTKELFAVPEEEGEKIYNKHLSRADFSQAYYFGNEILSGVTRRNLVYFGEKAVLDLSSHRARLISQEEGPKEMKDIFIFNPQEDGLKEYRFSGPREHVRLAHGILEKPALFIRKGLKEWRAVRVSSRQAVNSIFCRLYFMRGWGLEHFELFSSDEDAGIYVYRIKWS